MGPGDAETDFEVTDRESDFDEPEPEDADSEPPLIPVQTGCGSGPGLDPVFRLSTFGCGSG